MWRRDMAAGTEIAGLFMARSLLSSQPTLKMRNLSRVSKVENALP